MLLRPTLLTLMLLLIGISLQGQVAICEDVLNAALPSNSCSVSVSADVVDAGSYVPAGKTMTLTLAGGQNMTLGRYTVRLTVTARNPDGSFYGSSTCQSEIIVEDKFPPTANCADKTYYLVVPDQPYTINVGELVTASDNCYARVSYFYAPDTDRAFGSYTYRATVTDDAGNAANCFGTITTVDAEPQNYCSAFRNSTYEYIDNIRIQTASDLVDITSGNDRGYRHHPPDPGLNTLYHGYSYTLAYRPGFTGSSYHQYWSVYLDKNGDGDFTDSGELLHEWNGYGGNSFSFVSPGTIWGWSRIRIVMRYGRYGNPCDSGYGETEDLSVYLQPRLTIPGWPPFGFLPEHDLVDVAPAASLDLRAATSVSQDEPPLPGEAALRDQLSVPGTGKGTNVFPNPVMRGGSLSVRAPGGSGDRIDLLDLNGKIITTYAIDPRATSTRLELSSYLPAGQYVLRGGEWTKLITVSN